MSPSPDVSSAKKLISGTSAKKSSGPGVKEYLQKELQSNFEVDHSSPGLTRPEIEERLLKAFRMVKYSLHF